MARHHGLSLRAQFRIIVMSGMTALGSLLTSCNTHFPEDRADERQKTELVIDPKAKETAPEEKNYNPFTKNTAGAEGRRAHFAPAGNRELPSAYPAPRHGLSAAVAAPEAAFENRALKMKTIPVTLTPEHIPFNIAPNINLSYIPARIDTTRRHFAKTRDTKWKFKVQASHAFTHYFPSDITIRTSRYDVKISDYEWRSRDGNDWFSPKKWREPGNNPFQMIDEPTNTLTFSMEKNAHIFFISAFHPKFYQNPGQVKHIQGMVDGVPVDHTDYVNTPFHGYVQVPGEMKLVRNENTYRQMEYEFGYAHRFNLVSSRKFGTLSYVPGISAGFQTGATVSVVVKKGAWWDFDDYHEKNRIQGVGGSIRNRIEWGTPGERFGIFYENKTAFYHRHHALLDGTQTFNLTYTSNNVGMTFMLYNPNRHKNGTGPKL